MPVQTCRKKHTETGTVSITSLVSNTELGCIKHKGRRTFLRDHRKKDLRTIKKQTEQVRDCNITRLLCTLYFSSQKGVTWLPARQRYATRGRRETRIKFRSTTVNINALRLLIRDDPLYCMNLDWWQDNDDSIQKKKQ